MARGTGPSDGAQCRLSIKHALPREKQRGRMKIRLLEKRIHYANHCTRCVIKADKDGPHAQR